MKTDPITSPLATPEGLVTLPGLTLVMVVIVELSLTLYLPSLRLPHRTIHCSQCAPVSHKGYEQDIVGPCAHECMSRSSSYIPWDSNIYGMNK